MKNELLAPASNLEAVKVVINAGADAVYCAGTKFGARSFISNLTDEDIIEASKYVHLHGKKIYITLNTLIFEDELEEVKSYIDFLYQYVDALIVQDYGIVHYIRSTYPDFPIHLSTQTSIHTKEDILFLKKIGVSRVVLAREVSIDEIKLFNELGVELEVFIHGALCFSYSGMCYLSYYKGGRSGNRGSCAQPCRQDYSLLEDGVEVSRGPLLSMKDLNTIDNIKSLLDLGVCSLKVEGRAKSLEYQYIVTSLYRDLIDQYNRGEQIKVNKEKLYKLYVAFSRERTKGYIFNEHSKDVTVDSIVKHQGVYIGKVIGYKNKQVTISLKSPLDINDGIRIVDGKYETGSVVTRIFSKGQLVKHGEDIVSIDVKDRINVGALVFKTSSLDLKKEAINASFNRDLDAYLDINISNHKQIINAKVDDIEVKEVFNNDLEKAITVNKDNLIKQFSKTGKLPIKYNEINYVDKEGLYIPIPLINEMRNIVLEKLKDALENRKMRSYIPYPYNLSFNKASRSVDELHVSRSDFVSDKGDTVTLLHDIKEDSIIDPYFGVTNSLAVSFFRQFTKGVIILGYESTYDNSLSLSKIDDNLGYLVSYKEPLMVSKHCVVAKAFNEVDKKCGRCCKHQYQLKDHDNGRTYDLMFRPCSMYIEGKKVNSNSVNNTVNVFFK